MKRVYATWMREEDIPTVMAIDRKCFRVGLPERVFRDSVYSHEEDLGAIVVRVGTEPVGFMLYEQLKTSCRIYRIGVSYDHRLNGYGRLLVAGVAERMKEGRDRAWTVVSESNVAAQKFFSKVGFKAVNVVGKSFDTLGERKKQNGYWMVYRRSSNA